MITPARSCASAVDAARCGVTTTWSSSSSGPEYGSSPNTSIAAPATFPERIGVGERGLVHQLAAGGVHDADAVTHRGECLGVEKPSRLVVQREVERDHVRRRVDLLEGRGLHTELAEPVERDERVVGDHAHPERERAPRDLPPDAPEPQHAERLARELDPGELRPLPASRPSGLRAPAGRCGRARA